VIPAPTLKSIESVHQRTSETTLANMSWFFRERSRQYTMKKLGWRFLRWHFYTYGK